MKNISSKKKKFIKRYCKQLSIEELVHKTGLKLPVVRSLVDQYRAEMSGKDHSTHINKRTGFPFSWKTILLTSLTLTVITFIIYSPSLHGDFIFDDVLIKNNSLIHMNRISQLPDLLFSNEISRRIGLMSFALNYYFGGFTTLGYHLVNVIIHILNGLALFLLAYTILTLPSTEKKEKKNSFMIAFLGSLLWLVHPMQSQAVSYVVQRLTSLSALFFLFSLLCYLKGRINTSSPKKSILFVLCMVFGLLALGTKQNAATLPLFIILSELLFFQHYPLKLDKTKWAVFICLAGLFILIAWGYLGSDIITKLAQQYEKRGWTPLERVLTQLRVITFYLSLLIYPHPSRLNLDHDFSLSQSLFSPFTTFLSLLAITGVLVLAILFIKRNLFVSYALFWFLGNLVIESSIIPLELVFEHRVYLPSMGLMVLVSGLWMSVPKREWQKWAPALIIPPLLLFSYWTYERASVWKGPISLWEDAVQKSPKKARPHNNLCRIYGMEGRLDEAIPACKKALDIDPAYAKARNNLGAAFQKKGMLDEAISEFQKAITINPNLTKAYNSLGLVYSKKGMLDEAISEYRQAITIYPDYAEAHYNLGLVYDKKGMLDEAILACKKATDINPHYGDAHYYLGLFYANKGALDKAISAYKRTLAVEPRFAKAYSNLGVTYAQKGMLDESIAIFKKALKINPDLEKVHCNLGSVYSKKNMLDEAIAAFKKALLIKPNYAKAHNNLAAAYYSKRNYTLAIVHLDKAVELGYRVEPQFQKLLNSYR